MNSILGCAKSNGNARQLKAGLRKLLNSYQENARQPCFLAGLKSAEWQRMQSKYLKVNSETR